MLTAHARKVKPISALGRWWPTRGEVRRSAKPFAISSGVGVFVGLVPAAGGDIAGLIGWDRSRRASKTGDTYGEGNLEGVVAADTASSATLGGSLTTTMALGIPGDSVMAVMIGSMLIWGLQPGPRLFTERPELLVSITGIMLFATLISLVASLARLRGMVKLLDTPNHLLWPVILIFCVVGTYATTNNIFTVGTMLVFGVIGVLFKRIGIPAGPIVLGLLLGPIAEENLSRTLVLSQGQSFLSVWSPVALFLLLFSAVSLLWPLLRRLFRKDRRTLSETIAEDVLDDEPTDNESAPSKGIQ
jgi:putative tricarboxylic transport membrane protein